jgi:hypothetical protein
VWKEKTVKKYKEFPFITKLTKGGWYYVIAYTPEEDDIFFKTEMHRTQYDAYVELANKIDEFYVRSKQPKRGYN